MPETGGRILIASDGVWDAFEKMLRVSRMSRSWSTQVRQCCAVLYLKAASVLFKGLQQLLGCEVSRICSAPRGVFVPGWGVRSAEYVLHQEVCLCQAV